MIALRQLSGRRYRLLTGLLGIIAAVLMMSIQIGFREALYESAVRFHRSLDTDIVVTSGAFVSLTNMPRFSDAYVYRAAGFPGVASAIPLYADAVPWRNPQSGIPRLINVYGFPPGVHPFLIEGVAAQAGELADPEAVLFDRLSRSEFGPIAAEFGPGDPQTIGLSLDQRFPGDRSIKVVGLFALGPSFVIDGDIITSDRGFQRITGVSLDRVTFGLIKTRPGTSPDTIATELQRGLGPTVRVLTKTEFIALEKRYWAEQTSIGFIFSLGLVIGFLVGAVFVYQVIFMMIHEHLGEYAVLKSLGYSGGFLYAIIVQAAAMIGIAALSAGLPLALVVAAGARAATGLPVTVDPVSAGTLIGATLVMALLGGGVAARSLRGADVVALFA